MKKLISITTALLMLIFAMPLSGIPSVTPMYYELRIYRYNTAEQQQVTDEYLKNAFLPALHRAGLVNIGVFKPVESDTAYNKITYVFIPYNTAEDYFNSVALLEKDQEYHQSGKEFLDPLVDKAPFIRYESVFMKAFPMMPQMKTYSYDTPVSERIYELRSYESATEEKAATKIRMFNEGGEMKIFESIGSNPVFFGQVLFGSLKPRLMYMTTYENMKTHDEKWDKFRNSPEWKKLSSMEEYKNSTSKTNAYLLHPTDYSEF
jgi:hypothetical protein